MINWLESVLVFTLNIKDKLVSSAQFLKYKKKYIYEAKYDLYRLSYERYQNI